MSVSSVSSWLPPTDAVNLNAESPRRGEVVERSREKNETAPIDDSYSARIRQFLGGIGESLKPSGPGNATMFDLLNRSFETMQNAIAAVKLAAYSPGVVIEVSRDACGAHEFYRAWELIDLGYRLATEAVPARKEHEK